MEHAIAYTTPRSARVSVAGDRYLLGLSLALLGYALCGRGFAYLGVQPLFISEVLLFWGLATLLWSSRAFYVLHFPLARVVLLMMLWGAVCTLPHLATYGIFALRDAVLWGYAVFAFVVAGLLIERPERLRTLLFRYRSAINIFAVLLAVVMVIKRFGISTLTIPGTTVGLIAPRSGEVLVHVAGVGVFLMVGLTHARWYAVAALMITFVLGNRAGMLACAIALCLAGMLVVRKARVVRLVYALAVLALALVLVNPSLHVGKRTLSPDQMATRWQSIFTDTGTRGDHTKDWRLDWWASIVDYTVFGPYFWTGKGYGINLADSDGFQVLESGQFSSLRSPHNSHMTMLARSGVPGFVLWCVVLLGWLGYMFAGYVRSRRRHEWAWNGVFLFLALYGVAFLINACFDVVLEGPSSGIWFWSLFGVGLAAGHIYRYQPELIT